MNWYLGFNWSKKLRYTLLSEYGGINITNVNLSALDRNLSLCDRHIDELIGDIMFQSDKEAMLFLFLKHNETPIKIPDDIANKIILTGVIELDYYPGFMKELELYTYGYFIA